MAVTITLTNSVSLPYNSTTFNFTNNMAYSSEDDSVYIPVNESSLFGGNTAIRIKKYTANLGYVSTKNVSTNWESALLSSSVTVDATYVYATHIKESATVYQGGITIQMSQYRKSDFAYINSSTTSDASGKWGRLKSSKIPNNYQIFSHPLFGTNKTRYLAYQANSPSVTSPRYTKLEECTDICADATHVYLGFGTSLCKHTYSPLDTAAVYAENASGVCSYEGSLYICGAENGGYNIKVFSTSNLSTPIAQYSVGGILNCITVDANYIYVGGATSGGKNFWVLSRTTGVIEGSGLSTEEPQEIVLRDATTFYVRQENTTTFNSAIALYTMPEPVIPPTNMPPAPTDPIWSRPNVCPDNPFTVLGVELADETIPYPLDGDYELTEDIVLNPDCGHAVGTDAAPFTGTFDGKGFSISGSMKTYEYSTYFGLFGVTSGATLKNFIFDNVWLDYRYHSRFQTSGLLVAKAINTTIENITITAPTGIPSDDDVNIYSNPPYQRHYGYVTVFGVTNVGGVVGYACNGTTLTDIISSQSVFCYQNQGNPEIDGYQGNLVGRGDDITITNCSTTASPENAGDGADYSGGLVGKLTNSTITNCVADIGNNSVNVESIHGGLIGYSENNIISRCSINSSMNFDNTTQMGLFIGLCHNANTLTACKFSGNVWNVLSNIHSFDYYGKNWMGAFCNTMTSDTPSTSYTTFEECIVHAYGTDTAESSTKLEAPEDNLIKVIDASIPKASIFTKCYVSDIFCKANNDYANVEIINYNYFWDASTFPSLNFVTDWVETAPVISIRSTTDFQNTSVSRWLSAQATPADSWELALSNTTMTSADNCMVVGNQTYLFQTNVARAATGTPNILTRYVGTTADLTIAVGQTTGDFAYWSQIEAMSYDDDYIYVLVDKVSSGLYIEKIDFNLAAGSRIISSTAVVLDSAEDIIEGGNRTSHLFVGNDYVNAYVVVSPTKIYYKLLFDTDLSLIRSWKYDKKQELLAIATLES